METLQRPFIIQSRAIGRLCPLRRHVRHNGHLSYASPASLAWSQPPSSASVADDEVARLAAKPMRRLTLADLVKHGRPPLSESALLASANFTLSLLPIRLAHRIKALRNLPFIVVSNPHISTIYNNYLHSLETLLPYANRHIDNLNEEIKFTEVMADLVQTHSNTIPTLARGFFECRRYIPAHDVTRFLDEHLRVRIGTRLIAEQHLALHFSSQPHRPTDDYTPPPSSYIGVIDTALRPADIIRHCESFVSDICELKYGVRPHLVINGQPDTTLAHVPVHVEYIITELLKNAFRATVESGNERYPIEVTIAAAPGSEQPQRLPGEERSSVEGGVDHAMRFFGGEDTLSTASATATSATSSSLQPIDPSTPGVTIRIRDRGGGISPVHLPNIWRYSFTTFKADEDLHTGNGNIDALNMISGAGGEGSSIAGLGYGLPLGRAYAEYFGGGIALQSLYGWGTDVYLTLKGVGKGVAGFHRR